MSPGTVPDCPDCESDVFVDRAHANDIDYVCHLCDTRFDVVGDEVETRDRAGEGSVASVSPTLEPRG